MNLGIRILELDTELVVVNAFKLNRYAVQAAISAAAQIITLVKRNLSWRVDCERLVCRALNGSVGKLQIPATNRPNHTAHVAIELVKVQTQDVVELLLIQACVVILSNRQVWWDDLSE